MISKNLFQNCLIDWNYLYSTFGYSEPDADFLRLVNSVDATYLEKLSYFYHFHTCNRNIIDFLKASESESFEFHPLINFDHIKLQVKIPPNNVALMNLIMEGKVLPNLYVIDWWRKQIADGRPVKEFLKEIFLHFESNPDKFLHPFSLKILQDDYPVMGKLSTLNQMQSFQKIGDLSGRGLHPNYEARIIRKFLANSKISDTYPHRDLCLLALKFKKSVTEIIKKLEEKSGEAKKIILEDEFSFFKESDHFRNNFIEYCTSSENYLAPLAKHDFPSITAVIPFYKNEQLLRRLLNSLKKQKYKKLDVLVLCDDPLFSPKNKYPNVTFKFNSKNLGFLKNVNAHISKIESEYIFLLNSDIEIADECLIQLVTAAKLNRPNDIFSPILFYPDNNILQEAGGIVNLSGEITNIAYGSKFEPKVHQGCRFHEVDHVSGAAMFFKNKNKALFDDRYAPAYCEDLDLCFETRKTGGRVFCVTTATAFHALSASYGNSGVAQLNKLELISQNITKFTEKWKDELIEINQVEVVAFYLPQFHSDQVNNRIWGAGFTEWSQVSKSIKYVEGQPSPLLPSILGYYDLSYFETMIKQWGVARKYGVTGFCLYHYRFNCNDTALTLPLKNLVKNIDSDIRFMLCWANENWTKAWDGLDAQIILEQDYSLETLKSFAEDFKEAISCKNYMRDSKGRPLLSVYRMTPLKERNLLKQFKEILEKTVGEEVSLFGVLSMDLSTKNFSDLKNYSEVERWIEFPPQGFGVSYADSKFPIKKSSEFKGNIYSYPKSVIHQLQSIPNPKVIPGCFVDWDNTPRRGPNSTLFLGSNPTTFSRYIQFQLNKARYYQPPKDRYVFINAWNEWAESAILEPTTKYGFSFLQGLSLAKKNIGLK